LHHVDAYTVALGYESLEVGVVGDTVPLADLDHLIVGVSGTFGGATLKANYGKADGTVDGDAADLRQYAVSASYTVSGVGVTGFLNNRKLDLAGAAEVNDQAIGLGVSYDLGGGATAKAGVARVKDKLDNTSSSAFDVGVAFSF
jgi:outer membrane protein OmpU